MKLESDITELRAVTEPYIAEFLEHAPIEGSRLALVPYLRRLAQKVAVRAAKEAFPIGFAEGHINERERKA